MATKIHYKVANKIEAFFAGGAISLSKTGHLIACAYYDEVKVVDSTSGAVVNTLTGDTEPITALSFSASLLFGSSRSLQLFCWDLTTSTVRRSWKVLDGIIWKQSKVRICKSAYKEETNSVFQTAGGLLASGSADRTVRVWNTDGFYCTHVFRGHSAVVLRVLFHSRELNLISSAEDGEIRVWDLVSQSCLATLKGHFNAATALSLTSDGWTLLSAGRDSVAILWDLRNYSKTTTIPVFEAVEGAQLLPDVSIKGKDSKSKSSSPSRKDYRFVTAGEKGFLKVWSSAQGKCLTEQSLPGPIEEGSELTTLERGEGNTLMSTTQDGRITFVDIAGLATKIQENGVESSASISITRELVGDQGEITDLRFVGPPSKPTHLAVATNSAVIRLYNMASKAYEAALYGHTDMVLALDCVQGLKGGQLLASGSKDCSFRLWRLQADDRIQASLVASARAHDAAVTAVAFGRRSGGNMFVTAASDRMLKLWNLKGVLSGKSSSKDLQSLAAVEAHEKDINCVAVSPNESLICSTSQDRTAKVWKLPSLVLHLKLSGHKRGVWAAEFSPLEQIVATASGDRTIRLWSIKDGTCLRTLQGHNASVLKLCYLSNGLQVLSSGGDGLLKLWEVRSGECIATFEQQEGKVWALTCGGEQDNWVASGGADSLVNIWQDASQEKLEEADAARALEVGLQQDFSNALQAGQFSSAAALAFKRRQSKQLLQVLKDAQEAGQHAELLNALTTDLSAEDLKYALQTLRDWNTKAGSAQQAQALLHNLLSAYPPEVLRQVPGIEETLAGIVPYTQRHVAHLDRMLCSSYILDYSLSRLQYIPEDAS